MSMILSSDQSFRNFENVNNFVEFVRALETFKRVCQSLEILECQRPIDASLTLNLLPYSESQTMDQKLVLKTYRSLCYFGARRHNNKWPFEAPDRFCDDIPSDSLEKDAPLLWQRRGSGECKHICFGSLFSSVGISETYDDTFFWICWGYCVYTRVGRK